MTKHTLYDCANKCARLTTAFKKQAEIKALLTELETEHACSVTLTTEKETVTFCTEGLSVAAEPTKNYVTALYAELGDAIARTLDELAELVEKGE